MERKDHLDALTWEMFADGPLDEATLTEIGSHLEAMRADVEVLGDAARSAIEAALRRVNEARRDPAASGRVREALRQVVESMGEEKPARPPEPAPDADLMEMFLASCNDGLESLEASLLALEAGGNGVDLEEIKRTIHTFKGECGVLSLDVAQRLCHTAEDAVDDALTHGVPLPTDALLALVDWCRRYLVVLEEDPRATPPPHEGLMRTLSQPSAAPAATAAPATRSAHAAPAEALPDDAAPVAFDPEALEDDTLPEFLGEAVQHLEDAEAALLELEEDPSEEECINRIFRAFHTIKGVAGFLNLKPVCDLAHSTETLLGKFRQNELVFTTGHGDLLLNAKDMMARLLDALLGRDAPRAVELAWLIRRIDDAVEHPIVPAAAGAVAVQRALQEIGIVEDEDVERAAREPNETFGRLGDLLVGRGLLRPEELEEALERQHELAEHGSAPKIGELLVQFGFVTQAHIQEALQIQGQSSAVGQLLETKLAPRTAQRERKTRVDSTIKVSTTRLDALVDMVGELVIAQQMVVQDEALANRITDRLERSLSQLSKITRDLQEASMSLRMVTFRSTFQKMHRLVRDVSAKAHKETRLLIEGADTEVDRNVVEKISDPLVHLIRNAIDHGLEGPEERAAAGKPAEGTVTLSARHQGGAIVIAVQDDGRGLVRTKILAKAVERGLVASDAEAQDMSDSAVYRLIFQPGFSTAKEITDISGRGVGMDVVRRNIESMRGKIDIQSVEGEGTTFFIQLPLTLAIIDAMLVRSGDERFVIPTLSIVQSFRPDRDQVHALSTGASLVDVRGSLLPVHRLDEVLWSHGAGCKVEDSTLILLEAQDRRVCLMVDEILGQQQVVIKSLGEGIPRIRVVSGGAILGDGRVALIIDVEGLLSEVESAVQC